MYNRRYLLGAGLAAALGFAARPVLAAGFAVDRTGDGLIMPVTIAGRTLKGVFDSGASRCLLDTAVARSLGLTPVQTLSGKAIYGDFKAGVTAPVVITVGDAGYKAPLILASLNDQGLQADLLIGRDILDRFCLDLDGPNRVASFLAKAPPPGMTLRSVAIGKRGSLVVDVMIEGVPAKASLDSGSSTPLMLQKAWADQAGILKGHALSAWVSGDVTGIHPIDMTTLHSAALGASAFRDIPAEVSDTELDYPVNLGLPVLERLRTFWDIPQGRLWVAATPQALSQPFSRERSGLALDPQAGALKVIFVAPGSPAARAGWKTGDIVTAIDGVTVAGKDPETLLGWKHDPARTSVRLTLANGEARTLALAAYY